MYKYLVYLSLCCTLSACGAMSKSDLPTSDIAPYANQEDIIQLSSQGSFPVVSACQSVQLFDQVDVEQPDSDISERQSKFSGRWGNGRWNNALCQDVHVLRIYEDGTADIFDGQGPYEPWGVWAAGFIRKATFIPAVDERGDILRVKHNRTIIDYWVQGNTMYGVRQEPNGDQLLIKMARK